MKVAELQGLVLDYWVARADGWFERNEIPITSASDWCDLCVEAFRPSTRWEDGGPIIERESISVENLFRKEWSAWLAHGNPSNWAMDGLAPLVAAMRCYVASKYGDEVPDA